MRALAMLALLLPGMAHADPVTIGAGLLSAATGVGLTAASVAVGISLVAVNVYGAASQRRKARKAAAAQRAEYNASLQDRNITALSANPPWRVIYGRCITGGDIVAIFTSSKTGTREDGSSYTKPDAYKHLVIVLAAHQVQAINEVYIDGVALGTLDVSGWVTTGEFYIAGNQTMRTAVVPASSYVDVSPAVTTIINNYSTVGAGLDAVNETRDVTLSLGNTRISNAHAVDVRCDYTVTFNTARVRVSKHLGTDSQTVDTYLNGVVPSQWDSNHRLRGLAYVVVTLDLEETRFQGGPPNLTFDVSGKLIYDTRTSTTAYSTNPALIVRDFLMAPWGYTCASAEIDTALCNTAANACDVAISLTVGGVTTTGQPTFTCNGAFIADSGREAVLEDLCECMAGYATYGATWGIVAGAWTASAMTLTDDDLDGQIEIVQAGAGLDSIFNGIRGQYIAAGKSTPSDFDSYSNSSFVFADGEALWTDIALPFTDNKARARNLARIFTERNRDGLVIRYPAKLKAWPLQIGDRVTVTSAEYGFSSKTFRVTDWQFGASTAVQLTLQEDAAAVYDLADAATADPAPNTALPNPWGVSAITGLTATSGASTVLKSGAKALIPRILVEWDAITNAYVVDGSGRIELLWKRQDSPWQQMNLPGDSTSAYIIGVDNRDFVAIDIYARNGLGQRGPSTYEGHVVIESAASIEGSLVDATWWRPGASWEWNKYETTAGENSIVWGTGPKGTSQALWKAVSAGTGSVVRGGWEQGTDASNPKQWFVVDPTKTYRYSVPVKLTSGTGSWFFAPAFGDRVCTLNTSTLADAAFVFTAAPVVGRWCLLVGYVYPAGSTGQTNAGAGIYDMETGALLVSGTNYCWASGTTDSSMRAFLFGPSSGATNYWSPPVIELFDGSESDRFTYIGAKQVTAGDIVDSSTTTGSTGSPGSSTRVATLWGPTVTTLANDELDIYVSGVLNDTFWSQAVIAKVQVWLTHAPTFGGTQTEFGTRVKYASPIDVYTSSTNFPLEIKGQIAPGAVTQDYVLRVSIDYIDAAGAAKQCGKDFTSDAQWRVVTRKH